MSVLLLPQYLTSNFWNLTFPVVLAVAVSSIIYLAVIVILGRTKWHKDLRRVVLAVFRGPVPASIIGYSFVFAAQYKPTVFAPYLAGEYVSLLVELVVLATSLNAVRKISLLLFRRYYTGKKVSRKFLLIGVYSLGLVAMFYIILTSPVNSAIETGSLPLVEFISGVVITYVVAYILNMFILRYQEAIQKKQPQIHTTLTFARRILVGVVILIGVGATGFASFPGASGAIASLFVAAGFTSIVIGLAAQSSLSNLIAGGVISTSQPFRIGDAVSYNNEYCYVEDIRLMFSILRTWDNRRLMVPNSKFLATDIINYTAVDTSIISIIWVQITYESDMDLAMKIMKDVVSRHPNFIPTEGYPSVQVIDFTDYGVQLRALGMAKNQSDNWTLEKESMYEIKKEFDRQGVRIAVPRREVVLRDSEKGHSAKKNGISKGKDKGDPPETQ